MGVGLVRTIAGRSLLRRPGRTLFSIAGIAVGIATVVGIFALDHNTVLGRAREVESEWQADIRVSPSALAKRPREELEALPGVEGVAATFQNDAGLVLPDDPEARAERVRLVALDPGEALALDAYAILAGRDLAPAAVDPPQVLVGEALARRLGLGVGDTVLLGKPRRPPRKDCVDGEWQVRQGKRQDAGPSTAFEVVGVLAREGLGRRSRGEVVVVTFAAGQALFEGTHLQTEYWLKHAPDFNLEELESQLGQAYSYELQKSVIVGQAADERAFRNGVRFAGLLAMVLGLFVIFHTLSMSLLERVREVAALHALGATRRQVARIFLTEASVIAGLGGLFGLGGGLLLAKLLLRKGVTTVGVGFPIHSFDVPWLQVAPLALVGVLIALAGSVFPLLRARHASVARVLRGEDEPHHHGGVARGFQIFAALLLAGVLPGMYFVIVPVVGEAQAELVGVIMVGVGILALFVTLPLIVPSILGFVCARIARPFQVRWPLAGKLAARSIQQNPARAAGAVAAIALVTAGFVGLRGMTRSLEAEIDVWGREAFLRKVYLRNLPKTNFDELCAALAEYPGVLGVEPGDARTYVPFLLLGLDVEQLTGYGPLADDPALLAAMREGGAIVSRRLANHNGYEIGSQLHVSTGRGRVESLPVVAISDAYGYFPHPDERLYAVVSDELVGNAFCIDTDFVTTASVRIADDASYETVRAAVTDFLPSAKGVSFETGPYLFRWHSRDIRRDFVLFDIILGLTVVLAALGILNGQLLAALERAKELGVLKALGMTLRQVAGTVLLEALVVGLVGGAVGVLVGAALSPVIVRALETISGLPLPARSAGAWMLAAWIGAAVVAAGACLYPIWRIHRMSAVAAVRTGG